VAEYIARLPRDPDSARLRAAIEHRFMRINRRSVFSGEPGLHFALGVDPYSRFSAPMREIVGIFTHKEALEKLDPSRATASPEEDSALRVQVIAAAHRSRALQRKLDKDIQKLAMDHVFADDLNLPADARPRRAGTVCGVSASKVYVSLDDPPMELKLYAEDLAQLQDLALTLDDDGLRVYAGERALRVGDMVRVYVGGYLASRGRWQMLLD
jgi:ribonuclease R